ncbi:MAG: hypothetical protein AAF639_39530 [Chloroflexota bacterium]
MKITSHYPSKVFYRFFRGDDTTQAAGLKEGFLHAGQTVDWEDHHTEVRVEFKKGWVLGAFIVQANTEYSRDDELTLTRNGRVEVYKPYELQVLDDIRVEDIYYGTSSEVFDLRGFDAEEASLTRTVEWEISNVTQTTDSSQSVQGTTPTIGVEVGAEANVKGVDVSATVNYQLEVKNELTEVHEETVSEASRTSYTEELVVPRDAVTIAVADWYGTYEIGTARKHGVTFKYTVPKAFKVKNYTIRSSPPRAISELNQMLQDYGGNPIQA